MQLKYLFVKCQKVMDIKDVKIGGGDIERKIVEEDVYNHSSI